VRKLKIYLDTSVISYLDQTDTPGKMEITKTVWQYFVNQKYDIYLSSVTLEEIGVCKEDKQLRLANFLNNINYTELKTTKETELLAEKIIAEGILTRKSFDDCMHIASATLAECDIILSWNFKHLVNVKTINGIRGINILKGYKPLDIYSPDMLLEEE
jgi:predicted nucleic acid-binding protein